MFIGAEKANSDNAELTAVEYALAWIIQSCLPSVVSDTARPDNMNAIGAIGGQTHAKPVGELPIVIAALADVARKKPQHKLVFDNGEEIDLSQSTLIAAARPKAKALKTPNLMAGSSRNAFQSHTLAETSNKTPLPGVRSKMQGVEGSNADSTEDPLQRMVNLTRAH